MRSKSFSRFFRERSDVKVTTSLIPASKSIDASSHSQTDIGRPTRIFGVFRANVLIACIQNILIHQGRPRRHLPEEADLYWFSDFNPLSLLHKDLPCILASIFAVQTRYTVLFRVVAFFEGLQGGHEVMTASYTGGDDALGNTGSDSTFNDGSHGVHRANDFGLELWRNVEFDLLEEIFGSTEAADNKDILKETRSVLVLRHGGAQKAYLKDSALRLDGDNLIAD